MNKTFPNLLNDLNLYNDILPKIDKTITKYGKLKLGELFQVIIYDTDLLNRRQTILKTIIKSKYNVHTIKKLLIQIKKYEDDISWFFNQNDTEELYYGYEMLNNEAFLNYGNKLKIINPGITIIIYLLLFLILKYLGIKMDIKEYFVSIYNGYKNFITFVSLLVIDNIDFISFIANVMVTSYLLYQIYLVCNGFNSSYVHYKKCFEFYYRIKNIIEIINKINKIYNKDIFLIHEKKMLDDDLNQMCKIFNNKINLGKMLLIKKNKEKYEDNFTKLLQYIGLLDAFICIAELTKTKEFCFPIYEQRNNPYVYIENVWNPQIEYNKNVMNDFILGEPNVMIITGPNKSGKSTYLRSVMLSIFFAQTIGISCCKEIVMTPFQLLFTYINIPDVIGRESLFEAELNRCFEYYQIIKSLQPNQFSFAVIDESFTGTTPNDGIATSYGFCENISKYTNCLSIVSTHFHKLCELESILPNNFINRKFIAELNNNKYYFPYKLYRGISNQNIAIDLLQEKGYDNEIIRVAKNILKYIG